MKNLNEKEKLGTIWKVVYGDGTAEQFRAFTKEESKARQIAEFTALSCGGIQSIERKG